MNLAWNVERPVSKESKMSSQRRSLAAIAASFTLLSGFAIAGCQQEGPAGPSVTEIRLAKGGGGGKGPKVDSTDPTSAPQNIRLDVRVLGSGFDEGSGVTLTIDGNPQAKVVTNSTRFVNESELVADVTIDVEALIDLYDVEVLTLRGKRGVGADLFRVKPEDALTPTVTVSDDLTYKVRSDGKGTYVNAEQCVAVPEANFTLRTISFAEGCSAQPRGTWRYLTFDLSAVNNKPDPEECEAGEFDLDQDAELKSLSGKLRSKINAVRTAKEPPLAKTAVKEDKKPGKPKEDKEPKDDKDGKEGKDEKPE